MPYSINIKIFGELVEDFLVNRFKSIDVAGSVKAKEEGKINFIQIDLTGYNDWDQDSEKLITEIKTHLDALFKAKPLDHYYMVKFKNLTIDIITADTDHYLAKTLQLFYTNYQITEQKKKENLVFKWFKKNLQTSITLSITLFLAIISFITLHNNHTKQTNFEKGLEQINIFAGIMGAFALSYVLSKVIALRQEKLARVGLIRDLSYKLTCFRKMCYQLRKDHWFWLDSVSYKHAQYIEKQITYEDARFPDYDNEAKYASYRSLIITHKHDTSIVMFYLQLYMFAGEEFEHNPNLAWGSYPPVIIYSNDDIYSYISFLDMDEFWTCIDHNKTVFDYKHNRFYIDPIEKAASNYNLDGTGKATLSESLLLDIASDVQHKTLPELYHLTKLNEAKLPFVIIYLIIITSAMMVFSVIYPLLFNIFTDNFILKNLNGFVILGLVLDLMLRLPKLLKAENTLTRPDDYR